MDLALIEAMFGGGTATAGGWVAGGGGGGDDPGGWNPREPHDGHLDAGGDDDDGSGCPYDEDGRDLRFSLIIHSARVSRNPPSPQKGDFKERVTHLL